jgi:hypothetical protein
MATEVRKRKRLAIQIISPARHLDRQRPEIFCQHDLAGEP